MDLKSRLDELFPEMVSFRRTMHEYPDLSEEEGPVCARICERLGRAGIEHAFMLGGTAVCAVVRGRPGGATVGIRADLDALPVTEMSGLPFASKKPGVMHACGHDVHASAALGAALLLHSLRAGFDGAVKIFFQPAEETIGGARRMIEAGCLEDPRVDAVIGLHAEPSLPAGRAAFKPGRLYAASDEFTVVMRGEGCHGAHPENGKDAVVMAGQFITGLQSVVSRSLSPSVPGVVTVGKIEGGTKGNIIADRVELTGIMRSFGGAARELLRRRVEEVAAAAAAMYGGRAEFILRPSYPSLINDARITEIAAAAAREAIGSDCVREADEPTLGTEDFSYFAEARPSCFYWLGCGFKDKENYPLHSARFEADESCIKTGIELHAACALALLEKLRA